MTGFDIVDRYDIVMALVMGASIAVAINMGAPIWVPVLIIFIASVVGFIRHFDEIMGP